MPASSEIRFKIGADTSALSSAFTKAQSIAAVAGKQIEKKFSFKDAFKGMMVGMGIGSVDAIADAIVRPFQIAHDRSKDLLGMTTRMREITNKEIVAGGGRDAKMKVQAREVKDLTVDIQMQEKLVKEMNANPLNYINPTAMAMMREAEQELVNLKVRQAEVASEITTEEKLHNRFVDEFNAKQYTANKLLHAELSDQGERAKLQIRLNALLKEETLIKEQGDADTPRFAGVFSQRMDVMRQMRTLNKESTKQLKDTLSNLGSEIAGNSPAGAAQRGVRPRGRSEMERIAARGAMFKQQAEEAIRTGKSPEFIGSLASKARRDLTAAGEKVAAQTSMVKKEDAEALGGLFQKAVTELREINKNLTPKSTK